MTINDIRFKTAQGFLLTYAELGDLSEELGHERVKPHAGHIDRALRNGNMELIGSDTLVWTKGRLPAEDYVEEGLFYTLFGITDDELDMYTEADLERIAA